MAQKPLRPTALSARRTVSVTRGSRKLLVSRLREIDKLSAKEVAAIVADAEKIKTAFQLHR